MTSEYLQSKERQRELKHYLTKDELALPDEEREKLLIARKMVDQGLIDEMDVIANKQVIVEQASKNTRKGIPEWLWFLAYTAAFFIVVYFLNSWDWSELEQFHER